MIKNGIGNKFNIKKMNFRDELRTAYLATNNLLKDGHKSSYYYKIRIQSTFKHPSRDAIVLIKAIRKYFKKYGHNKLILSVSFYDDNFIDFIIASADGSILINNQPYHLKRWSKYPKLNSILDKLFDSNNIIVGLKYIGNPAENDIIYKLKHIGFKKSLFHWITDYNNPKFIKYVKNLSEYRLFT